MYAWIGLLPKQVYVWPTVALPAQVMPRTVVTPCTTWHLLLSSPEVILHTHPKWFGTDTMTSLYHGLPNSFRVPEFAAVRSLEEVGGFCLAGA